MNSSTSVDINYYSINGQTAPIIIPLFTGIDATSYSTILKITDGCYDFTLTGLNIPQGNETAVDLDISNNVHINGTFGGGPVAGENILRFKGGDINCSAAGQLIGRGTRNKVDIEIGDWMDQSYSLTKNIDLSRLTPPNDGKGKINVAIGWAVPFSTKLGENCRYMFWTSVGMKLYVITKFIIRFILRIPKGTKGPSWF